MTENLKKFLEKVSADKEAAKKAAALDKAGLIALAAELGLQLNDADFDAPQEAISESELAGVTGGGGCGCALAGGGGGTDENDGKTYGCACAIYGQGGDGGADDFNCWCAAGGAGFDNEEKFRQSF